MDVNYLHYLWDARQAISMSCKLVFKLSTHPLCFNVSMKVGSKMVPVALQSVPTLVGSV